jgi:hypothetical protein
MWPSQEQPLNFRPEGSEKWRKLDDDRYRYLETSFITTGRPIDDEHARYLQARCVRAPDNVVESGREFLVCRVRCLTPIEVAANLNL